MNAHHFGVTVTDLGRAVEFYRDVLGLDVIDRFTVSGEGFSVAVGIENATGNFVHLDAGDGRIELVEYDPAGRAHTDDVNQPGTKHVGLAVEDIEEFYRGLPEGVETRSQPRTTESGARILFVHDPEGNLVEIIEA
jgi:catechol 2,3-dioxygenase-like lactoylglutathione lyase family enzyme